MTRAVALFQEASTASPQAIDACLSNAGFDDITRDGLLVLGALALSGGADGGLTGNPGMTEQAVSQLTGTLIQRGYLELTVSPAHRGGSAASVTRRGYELLARATDGIRAVRWADFPFRPGDIVISTAPKSGTTWVQMICALLVFQTQDLPASLPELSPWMESDSFSRDEVYAQLAGQQHRRFIKTHLGLNEIPARSDVTYLVVARQPLDVAVSMYYQDGPFSSPPREWLLEWMDMAASPSAHRNSLPGAMRRMSYAWAHRTPNVVLVHYQDLSADLEGEMRRLAARLHIAVPEASWPSLVQAATFERMRAVASRLVDSGSDPGTFFRRGTSGSGRELLTRDELARYQASIARLAPADLLAWLHRDDGLTDAPDPPGGAGPTVAGPPGA